MLPGKQQTALALRARQDYKVATLGIMVFLKKVYKVTQDFI